MWLRHKAQGCAYCLTNRICSKAGANVPACFFMPLQASRRSFIAILQNLINLPRVMRITSRAVHDVCALAVVSGII